MALPASDLTKKPDLRTTMELGAVLPETAEVRDDHLFIGGVDMVQLAREEGTALYVFDEAALRHRMEAYREAFRSLGQHGDELHGAAHVGLHGQVRGRQGHLRSLSARLLVRAGGGRRGARVSRGLGPSSASVAAGC